MKKSVLIADADRDFRTELAAALYKSGDFAVVRTAADGEDALQMIGNKPTGILVIDLMMPKYDGLTLLEYLLDNCPKYHPQVLVTSAFISEYVAVSAVRLGAQQLIHKPCRVEAVVKTLQRMVAGENDGPAIFLWNGGNNVGAVVTRILHHIGVPAHIKGYQYLREAIILASKDADEHNAILKNRYTEVAQIFGTTEKRVETAIRHAVEVAWDRGDLDTLQGYFGYTVSNTKGKPTNSEFIAIVADRIRLWRKDRNK